MSDSQAPNSDDAIEKKKPFTTAGDMEQDGRDTIQSIKDRFQRALKALSTSDAHGAQDGVDEVGEQEKELLQDSGSHSGFQNAQNTKGNEKSPGDESVEGYQDAHETQESEGPRQSEKGQQKERGFRLLPDYGKSLHIYLWKVSEAQESSIQSAPQAADPERQGIEQHFKEVIKTSEPLVLKAFRESRESGLEIYTFRLVGHEINYPIIFFDPQNQSIHYTILKWKNGFSPTPVDFKDLCFNKLHKYVSDSIPTKDVLMATGKSSGSAKDIQARSAIDYNWSIQMSNFKKSEVKYQWNCVGNDFVPIKNSISEAPAAKEMLRETLNTLRELTMNGSQVSQATDVETVEIVSWKNVGGLKLTDLEIDSWAIIVLEDGKEQPAPTGPSNGGPSSYTPSGADSVDDSHNNDRSNHAVLPRDNPGKGAHGFDGIDESGNPDVPKDEDAKEMIDSPPYGTSGSFQLSSQSQKKFKLLPEVAERLRLYLWDVEVEDQTRKENRATSNVWKKVLSVTDPDPTTWRIRRDVRSSGLEVYTASFGGEPMTNPKIWLDPENGTVYCTEFKFETPTSQVDSIPPQPCNLEWQFNANSPIMLKIDPQHEFVDQAYAANPTLRASKFVKHEAEYNWNQHENIFEALAADIEGNAHHGTFGPRREILENIAEAFKELQEVTEVEIPTVKIVALKHVGGLKITDLELGERIVVVIDEEEESVDGGLEGAKPEQDTTYSFNEPERVSDLLMRAGLSFEERLDNLEDRVSKLEKQQAQKEFDRKDKSTHVNLTKNLRKSLLGQGFEDLLRMTEELTRAKEENEQLQRMIGDIREMDSEAREEVTQYQSQRDDLQERLDMALATVESYRYQ